MAQHNPTAHREINCQTPFSLHTRTTRLSHPPFSPGLVLGVRDRGTGLRVGKGNGKQVICSKTTYKGLWRQIHKQGVQRGSPLSLRPTVKVPNLPLYGWPTLGEVVERGILGVISEEWTVDCERVDRYCLGMTHRWGTLHTTTRPTETQV